jgi:hypothetical protein
VGGGAVGLVLRAVEVAGPHRWRWLLVDMNSGVVLADHLVRLNPDSAGTQAFEDLDRFLRMRAEPDRPVAGEAELVHRVGAWLGSVVLGEQISRAIATTAPVTVRVQVPTGAEFLAFRSLELAHIGGVPVAARGDVALVYDLPGPPGMRKEPVGAALRMLAVFSLPTAASAPALRRERYELARRVRRIAAKSRRRVELQIVQYGLTRRLLADQVGSEGGWDVLHLSGFDRAGRFLLQHPDGSVDPVRPAELVELLWRSRSRVKLAVVSACRPAAELTAPMSRWLGVADPTVGPQAGDAEPQAGDAEQAGPLGVARALVAELGCAVVAMRHPVVDEFAISFADALYDHLFRHTQPLDWALAEAVPAATGPAPSPARPAGSVAAPTIFGASAAGLSLAPPVGKPVPDPAGQLMAHFPPEPPRFVGRAEAMAAAGAALAPESGRTAVVFSGTGGAGKTTCALELAYRHQRAFTALAFWSAPTDPDRFGDALRLLAMALDTQLGDRGFAMADKIATLERLENFLPTLTTVLTNGKLLLVLDHLDTLLTPDGQWRDLRWVPLINALTSHDGASRVLLTSRVAPSGLDPEAVLTRPVPPLSRSESLLLARELPNLRTVLGAGTEPASAGPGTADPALGRRVLTLVQGHPLLLELADAAAADPVRLAARLTAADTGMDEMTRAAFLVEGDTRLDPAQLRQTLITWVGGVAATLPAPARLLLQALCRIEETDRSTAVLQVNWVALWRRLGQSGDPLPLGTWVAPLVAAALIATDPIDPADPDGPVHYRVHPGVTEAVHAATPEPVTAAVDRQLAAWWTTVGDWGVEQAQAGRDTSELVRRAGLSAARYLLRLRDWDGASCLLERVLSRDHYSPDTALAVVPALRRIAEATGARKDLVILASALRKLDPGEAETSLRHAYEQATAAGDHALASTTSGDLITLLRDQNRLREALTMAHQKIEHTTHAGFGTWTQLSDQGRRLQILSLLGHHDQVLTELPELRTRLADLPDQRTDHDRVNPHNVREGILDVGRCAALALHRWDQALTLNQEITTLKHQRNAGRYDTARTRFHDHTPLLHLGRLTDADHLLRHCQEVFDSAGDTTRLATTYTARAELADRQQHPQDATDLQRTALRLHYLRPDPRTISTAHHTLADYLTHAGGTPAEQRAHRLAAALLHHLTGDTRELTRTLRMFSGEFRGEPGDPDAPARSPTTLSEVIGLVDTDDRVRFGTLLATLCPDPAAAGQVLADLLATAATDQEATDQETEPAAPGRDHACEIP